MAVAEQDRFWRKQHRLPKLVTTNLEVELPWRSVTYRSGNNVVGHLIPGGEVPVVQHIAKQVDEINVSAVFLDREGTGEADSYSRIEELRAELALIPEKPHRFSMPFGRSDVPVYVRSFTFNHNTAAFGGVDFNLTLVVAHDAEAAAPSVREVPVSALRDQTEFDETTLPPPMFAPGFQGVTAEQLPDIRGAIPPSIRETTTTNLPNLGILRAERLIERPRTPEAYNSLIGVVDTLNRAVTDLGNFTSGDGVEALDALREVTGPYETLTERATELVNNIRDLSVSVVRVIDNFQDVGDTESFIRSLSGLAEMFYGSDHPLVQLAGIISTTKQIRTILDTDLQSILFDRDALRTVGDDFAKQLQQAGLLLDYNRNASGKALERLYAFLDETSPTLTISSDRRSDAPVPAIVLAQREYGDIRRRNEFNFGASPAIITDYVVRRL